MSEYQVKSEVFKTAAEQLNDSGLFAPVGHTAYYSCFLLFEHISCSESFDPEELDLRAYGDSGSHQDTINEITLFIHSKSRRDCQYLRSQMGELKQLRMSADYNNEPFTARNATRAIALMNIIRPLLNKYL